MSRFLVACSLVAALTTPALAHGSRTPVREPAMQFAQPVASERVVSRAAVRAKLAKARGANLARFRAYQQKGVFPSNTYTRGSLNVWIDDDGHLCAAATIIQASGHRALVQQVADENNFIRLSDVTSGALMDWILTSGLTQAEIAAIQEPFMGVDGGMREPAPILVDQTKRAAEDRRLAARYRQVDAAIVNSSRVSLDAATDRLMANPALAKRFLAR